MTRINAPGLALSIGLVVLGLFLVRPAEAADGRVVFDHVTSKWTVARNGTYVLEAEVHIRFPDATKLRLVQIPLTWSPSTETLQVVETRVVRANGQVLFLGKEAIQDAPLPDDQYAREFSDLHRIIITFTDAKPGDTVVVRTRRDVFRSRVPGGFATSVVLDHAIEPNTANYSISVPTGLPFLLETHGFEDQPKVVLDRTVHELRARAATDARPTQADLGTSDQPASFTVSTFRSWDDFAHSYASVLLPHAIVTPSIKEMASRLTGNRETERDQAKALYEAVRDRILSVLVPLDEGRPEPNDADQVLRKQYGDAKDEAVLLHALLAAKDIPSEFVLVNAGNIATLADPPGLSPASHMILYLPNIDTYLDPTLRIAPFGVLPFQELGKPAVHVGGSGPVRREIPIPPPDENWTELKTNVYLHDDGVISGTTETTARGAFGVWLRAAARTFGADKAGAAVKLLHQLGTPGSGQFSFDPPGLGSREFSISGTFRLDDKIDLSRGAYFAPWTGLRILPRPGDFLVGPLFTNGANSSVGAFCYPGTQREILSVTIPTGLKLDKLPKDAEVTTELTHFSAHWTVSGQRILVTREFKAAVPGPLCDGRMRAQMKDAFKTIAADYGNGAGISPNISPGKRDSGPDTAIKNSPH